MARPATRQQLVDYCLRKLGAPVVKINLDQDQIEDCVDDAIQFYQEYHSDAVVHTFMKHEVTAADVTNKWIPLPEAMISVFRVFPITTASIGGNDMFSVKYQMYMNDFYGLRAGAGGLVDYEIAKQYMGTIDIVVNGINQQITFMRHMNRLSIEVDWDDCGITEGSFIIVEGYQTIDPEEYSQVYNDQMLKKYLVATLRQQWGVNLSKFEGVQLPGGVTISGRAIYEDAKADLQTIAEEAKEMWQFPPSLFIG